jgi:hypothetical protein
MFFLADYWVFKMADCPLVDFRFSRANSNLLFGENAPNSPNPEFHGKNTNINIRFFVGF